jgi:hypothetical protein
MKTFLLKLPEELHTKVKVLAANSNVTMQDYMNWLLRDHTDRVGVITHVDKVIKKIKI